MTKKLLCLLFGVFCFTTYAQADTIKLISWNIQDFGKTKNSEELEDIADIVKHTDILAIQEVVAGYGGAQAVAKLTAILNRKGNKWDYVISNPTQSSKYVTERYAFIWKTKYIKIKNRGRLISELDSVVDREPFLLDFYLDKKELSIINYHSRPFYTKPESELKEISKFITTSLNGNVIFAGDFNMSEDNKAFYSLFKNGYTPAIFNKKTTLKKACKKNNYLNYAIDNIYYGVGIQKIEAKPIDFVKFCDNVDKARKLSDHLPIFLRFSIKK